jgi:hypothetical protein
MRRKVVFLREQGRPKIPLKLADKRLQWISQETLRHWLVIRDELQVKTNEEVAAHLVDLHLQTPRSRVC